MIQKQIKVLRQRAGETVLGLSKTIPMSRWTIINIEEAERDAHTMNADKYLRAFGYCLAIKRHSDNMVWTTDGDIRLLFKDLRLMNGLSMQDMNIRTNINPSRITKMEHLQMDFCLTSAERYAEAMDCELIIVPLSSTTPPPQPAEVNQLLTSVSTQLAQLGYRLHVHKTAPSNNSLQNKENKHI